MSLNLSYFSNRQEFMTNLQTPNIICSHLGTVHKFCNHSGGEATQNCVRVLVVALKPPIGRVVNDEANDYVKEELRQML